MAATLAGAGDAAFGGAGTAAGIEKWRIEAMKPVKCDPAELSQFYTGDSYIMLVTKPQGRNPSAFEWDIHFWLGSETTRDEMGVAAYKSVELDEQLGGGPVQHREVQGHESPSFMSHFKNIGGVSYMEGGVESGFNIVDPDAYTPRLYHLKGKRNIRCAQCKMGTESMNDGDVFILDAGKDIYQWSGNTANKYEKMAGLQKTLEIKNVERGGGADISIITMDAGKEEESASPEQLAKFWGHLGGKADIAEGCEESDDDIKPVAPTLHKISDADGEMKVDEVASGKLEHDMLDPKDCFIVDIGSEVFVWTGKGASKDERKESMMHAADFIEKGGRPSYTPITRVMDGAEPRTFTCNFVKWRDNFVAAEGDGAKKKAVKSADLGALYGHGTTWANEGDDREHVTGGKITVYRVESMEMVPYPEEQYGQFYSGDSFIVLYEYTPPGKAKPAWMLYFWQGRNSSQDEKAAVALFAKDLDDKLGGDPVQVRVVQNKEPDHFLALWGGKMVVHEGGVASGFKNRADADSFDTDGISLYHVRGSTPLDTRAVQVAEVAASLNSGDVFILLTPASMFVWEGSLSNEDERTAGEMIAKWIGGERPVAKVIEGEEPAEFWEGVGGEGEYAKIKADVAELPDPRLFQMSNALGYFRADEIFDFAQDDLLSDDVFMLDTYNEVFVWVGKDSNRDEQVAAFKGVLDYVKGKSETDGREADCPALTCNEGEEPLVFTCHFLGWEDRADTVVDPYAAKMAADRAARGEAEPEAEAAAPAPKKKVAARAITAEDTEKFGSKATHTLAELQAGVPPGVDPANKETYLADEEFVATFGVDKEKFAGLPAWKKKAQKQKHKLF